MSCPRYEPWQPAPHTDGEFFVVWLEDRPDSSIVLETEPAMRNGMILRFYFEDAIAYRKHPHDIMMLKWWGCGSFFQVIGSDWCDWLKQESQGACDYEYLHYGVRTIDGCYEFLTATPPAIVWLRVRDSLNPLVRQEE